MPRLSLNTKKQSPIVTSASPGLGAVRTFFTIIKGAPSARQADRPGPIQRRMRPSTESVNERDSAALERPGGGDSHVGGGAAWPASSCAIAHRRGPLPATPMPRTGRSPHPAVTHRGSRTPRDGRAGRLASGAPVAG